MVAGAGLPLNLSHFAEGRLPVRHGGALCSRRLRAASQTTSGYIAISTAERAGPSSGWQGRPLSTRSRLPRLQLVTAARVFTGGSGGGAKQSGL